MPNRFLTPAEAGKLFYEDMVRAVKKIHPDESGQDPATMNPTQASLFERIFDAFSRKMFYGRSPWK